MPDVLLIDDHPNTRETLAIGFATDGWHIDTAANAEQALALVAVRAYDWIVCDVRMPGKSGVELACDLRRRFPQTGLILMTAYELTDTEASLVRSLDAALLIKPVTSEQLMRHCQAVMADSMRQREQAPAR